MPIVATASPARVPRGCRGRNIDTPITRIVIKNSVRMTNGGVEVAIIIGLVPLSADIKSATRHDDVVTLVEQCSQTASCHPSDYGSGSSWNECRRDYGCNGTDSRSYRVESRILQCLSLRWTITVGTRHHRNPGLVAFRHTAQ